MQAELNFLDYVVSALWERLAEVLPNLSRCWETLKANRARYAEVSALRDSIHQHALAAEESGEGEGQVAETDGEGDVAAEVAVKGAADGGNVAA